MGQLAYMILPTQKDRRGWIPLVVEEGTPGFYRTSWRWQCSQADAEKGVEDLNNKMNLTKEQVAHIIATSLAKDNQGGIL